MSEIGLHPRCKICHDSRPTLAKIVDHVARAHPGFFVDELRKSQERREAS